MKLKVISFRTDQDQIDVLHNITHCTTNSASQIIRNAINRELEMIRLDVEMGGVDMDKDKQELLENYLLSLDHKDEI